MVQRGGGFQEGRHAAGEEEPATGPGGVMKDLLWEMGFPSMDGWFLGKCLEMDDDAGARGTPILRNLH